MRTWWISKRKSRWSSRIQSNRAGRQRRHWCRACMIIEGTHVGGLDDMMDAVENETETDETNIEINVEDETLVSWARDTLRRRPASRTTADEIRRHWTSYLSVLDYCPECIGGSVNDWHHRRRDAGAELHPAFDLHYEYCFSMILVNGATFRSDRHPDREIGMTTFCAKTKKDTMQ